jgi:hypothetical protein
MPDCQFQLFATDRTLPVIGPYIISRRQLRTKAHCHYSLSLEIQPFGFFQDTIRKCLKSRGVGLSPLTVSSAQWSRAKPPAGLHRGKPPRGCTGERGPIPAGLPRGRPRGGTYGRASQPDRLEMAAPSYFFTDFTLEWV